jgi:hypothetical protein
VSTPTFDRLLSIEQVAERLDISTRSVSRLLPNIGHIKLVHAVRIPEQCLQDFLQSRFRAPVVEAYSRNRAASTVTVASIADGIIKRHRRGAR